MKVVIVGGVAGGASCAARLRRLDEKAEILMVERGPYVSYANCGLPYHIGGVIPKESSLLVANEQTFRGFFRHRRPHQLRGRRHSPGEEDRRAEERRDGRGDDRALGQARPFARRRLVRPPLPGIDLPGIFHVRTVPDAAPIREWIEKGTPSSPASTTTRASRPSSRRRRAVVVGGGFIGLEMAENLVHAGFEVTLVEMVDQVLAPLDREHAVLVEEHLKMNGVRMALGDGVAGFAQVEGGGLEVETKAGKTYPADVVILALGVRPDTALAKAAGLEIGERGGIRVDEQMHTSDPAIFAVGDAVEVKDLVTGSGASSRSPGRPTARGGSRPT